MLRRSPFRRREPLRARRREEPFAWKSSTCSICGEPCTRGYSRCKEHAKHGPIADPAKQPRCQDCGRPCSSTGPRCRPCAYKARKAKARKQKICPACGKDFWPSIRRLIGLSKYCSRACYRSVQNRRPAFLEVLCDQCGKPFRRTAAALVRTKQHFCSKTCSNLFFCANASTMYRGGRDRTRGKGWIKLAEAVRRRDGYRCRSCGRTQEENGQKLSVDHVIPWRMFAEQEKDLANALTNLASLCKWCHSRKTSRAEQKWLRGDVLDFKAYEKSLTITSASEPP